MRNLNVIQTLAVTGIAFSIVVQLILLLIDKKIENIWALYPTWCVVFLIGLLLKKFLKEQDHHHHH